MILKNTNSKVAFSLIELSVVILVIGILVIGITKGSRIIEDSRLKSAQSLTNSAPVLVVNDLLLWLDTTDSQKLGINYSGSTNTDGFSSQIFGNVDSDSNNRVSNWKNNAINNSSSYSINQTTAANRPIYVKSAINNLPALQFNGSNYRLDIDDHHVLDTPNTIFVVAQQQVSTSFGSLITRRSGNANGGVFLRTVGSNTSYLVIDSAGYSNKTAQAVDTVTNKPFIAVGYYGGVGKKNYLKSNGTQYESTSVSAAVDNYTSGLAAAIGEDSAGNEAFNGYIAEIIVFGRKLKSTEITGIENYLSQKYNIPLS
jgi:hypothetical protein